MNDEVRAKWLTALRSGEYKQGKRVLRQNDKLCCLGVLCDLAVKEGIIPLPTILSDEDDNEYDLYYYDNEPTHLPYKVMRWAGISSNDPRVGGIELTRLNDLLGLPFTEIANRIEAAGEDDL